MRGGAVAAAIVQHGSVLLERSQAAPEIDGLAELTGVRLKPAELIAAWLPQLEAALACRWLAAPLTPAELNSVRTLTIEKYGSERWTRGR